MWNFEMKIFSISSIPNSSRSKHSCSRFYTKLPQLLGWCRLLIKPKLNFVTQIWRSWLIKPRSNFLTWFVELISSPCCHLTPSNTKPSSWLPNDGKIPHPLGRLFLKDNEFVGYRTNLCSKVKQSKNVLKPFFAHMVYT